MMKEERILFPMISQGVGMNAAAPISVMEHEHDDAGRDVEVVKALTKGVVPPEVACSTWRSLSAFLLSGDYRISSSSTSKISALNGGIDAPAPRSPYARLCGI